MQCSFCNNGTMRLVRFDKRQEIYACKSCSHESLLLDCHYCERRSVRRAPDSDNSIAVWQCYRCKIDQHKCPNCINGWVVPQSITESQKTGWECQTCHTVWHTKQAIK